MKKIKLILTIILLLTFTSCSSTDKADINEFIKRYNNISEYAILKEEMNLHFKNELVLYSIGISDSIILTIASNKNCEITECTISTLTDNPNNFFDDKCINTLIALTHCDKTTAEKIINESFKRTVSISNYEISTIKDNLQITVIIRNCTKNEGIKPTLKELINNY